jgi:anti-sigma regulatory factor (Ser/Thr protein kinase)
MRPRHTAPPAPARAALPPGASTGDLVEPFEMTLTAELDAPATARAAFTAWMVGHVAETMLADAQLLVGELVANSVCHADTPVVSVRAEIRDDALHLRVEDRGSSGSIARRAPDLRNGGGFGLNIVEELSRRWGVDRGAGTRVWAEIGAPAPARCRTTDREAAARPDGDGETDAPHGVTSAAPTRADGAGRRAVAARHGAKSAVTGHVQDRVADADASVARGDEHSVSTPPLGGDSDADAA